MMQSDSRLTLLQNSGCIAIAGIVSRTLTAPLDVIKIRTQAGCWETRLKYLNTIEHIYRVGGWKTFWRGNLIGCFKIVPYSIIQLALFTRLNFELSDQGSDDFGHLSPKRAYVVGAVGGVVATGMLYVSDTLKTRIISQPIHPASYFYKGLWHAFWSISKREGLFSLTRGMSSSALGVIPFTVTSYITCKTICHIFDKMDVNLNDTLPAFVTGCVTTGVAHSAAYPFDTTRKKMQAWSRVLPIHGGVDVDSPNLKSTIRNTVKHYGIVGLWRGYCVSVVKIIPYTGILYGLYEGCKNVCLYYNGYTTSSESHTCTWGRPESGTGGTGRAT